jgi:hypothetical protein
LASTGGWLAYVLAGRLVDVLGGGSDDWRLVLLVTYGFILFGYVFAALVTRIAPTRRYTVAVSLVFVTLLVAAALALEGGEGSLAAAVFGVGLVIGSVGFALRLRGFTERVREI